MTLPSPLGLNPFGQGSTVERVHALLRRMYGVGGYPTDHESNWSRELEAYATMLAVGGASIERAGQQAFVSMATDCLDEWEREVFLPNDAARTIEQRQTRLVALEHANAGADLVHVEQSIEMVAGAPIDALSVLRTVIVDEKTSDDSIFLVALQLALSEFGDPWIRRAAAQLAFRMQPARYGNPSVSYQIEDAVIGQAGAVWASAAYLLDRDALRAARGGAPAVTAPTHPNARLVDFGNLSKLRARDLNAIQSRVLACGTNEGDPDTTSFGGAAPGTDVISFAVDVANGATDEIDDSVDWRDRFVMVAVVASSTDIRPGQAGDTSFNDPATAPPTRRLWYTGTGGAAYALTLTVNLTLRVTSGTGELTILNTTGGAIRVAGTVIGSCDLGKR